jgi:hypothetical protein
MAKIKLDGRKRYGYDRFNPAAPQAFFQERRVVLLH